MGLLLAIVLIFTSGTFVKVSAIDKTICDRMLFNNTWCSQDSCDQPPCSLQCNQSYDSCNQNCHATTCNTMACSSLKTCVQSCEGGYCKEFRCDAMSCIQSCIKGGNCTTMRCTNSMPGSICGHKYAKELFCDSERCLQDCYDDCNMTCSSSVKYCFQTCHRGTCFYQCDAQTLCRVDCSGGNCPQLKTSTTLTPATSKIPRVGIRYVTISLVLGLLLAVLVFM